MTNGEKIKEIFPNAQIDYGTVYNYVWFNHERADFSVDWWNAEYTEPTTKNDLGVDNQNIRLIDANALIKRLRPKHFDWWGEGEQDDFSKGNNSMLEEVIEAIEELPSVTPQEPKKGHWIEEFNDLEGEVRFTCSSCGKYQLFGTDFCYHCGSDNREVEE